jgi:polysaccharide pyruvyl transferase WcaK-like protein
VVPGVARELDLIGDELGAAHLSLFKLKGSVADFGRALRLSYQRGSARGDRSPLTVLRDCFKSTRAMVSTEREFIDRVSRLSLLVTGRFHAVCVALAAGTPFLAVESNTHKIASLIEDASMTCEGSLSNRRRRRDRQIEFR